MAETEGGRKLIFGRDLVGRWTVVDDERNGTCVVAEQEIRRQENFLKEPEIRRLEIVAEDAGIARKFIG